MSEKQQTCRVLKHDSNELIHKTEKGMIKDRNGNDLTEVEEIKRWQEYIKELYTKSLTYPDNCSDVITHLELGILVCEVKGP